MSKTKPKRDGSGRGVRANRGRGGCDPPLDRNAASGHLPRPSVRRRNKQWWDE